MIVCGWSNRRENFINGVTIRKIRPYQRSNFDNTYDDDIYRECTMDHVLTYSKRSCVGLLYDRCSLSEVCITVSIQLSFSCLFRYSTFVIKFFSPHRLNYGFI